MDDIPLSYMPFVIARQKAIKKMRRHGKDAAFEFLSDQVESNKILRDEAIYICRELGIDPREEWKSHSE